MVLIYHEKGDNKICFKYSYVKYIFLWLDETLRVYIYTRMFSNENMSNVVLRHSKINSETNSGYLTLLFKIKIC